MQRYCFFLNWQGLWRLFLKKSAFFPVFSLFGASIHAVAVVFVGKLAQNLDASIEVPDGNGRVVNAVESGRLDGRVVYHVLEDDLIADLQGCLKRPRTHEIPREAGIASEAVGVKVVAVVRRHTQRGR